MQSETTTQFKQKTCLKCQNNHDNEGVLCSFCIAKAEEARSKIQVPPNNFWVKCLIEREGNTVLSLGAIQYTFKKNEKGDAVCEIINQGHYSQIIKSEFYEPYVPVDNIEKDDDNNSDNFFSDEESDLINRMQQAGEKHSIIAQEISKLRGQEVSRQRVTLHINQK